MVTPVTTNISHTAAGTVPPTTGAPVTAGTAVAGVKDNDDNKAAAKKVAPDKKKKTEQAFEKQASKQRTPNQDANDGAQEEQQSLDTVA